MKKIVLCLLSSIICFMLVACTEETTTLSTTSTTSFDDSRTIDCIIGYIWSGTVCVDDPNSIVFDGHLYRIFYEGTDYNIYRNTSRPSEGTTDIILLGDYNGMTYYFSSGSHYLYYLVVKNDEIFYINEALDAGWFTLEELVDQFNIEELTSMPAE